VAVFGFGDWTVESLHDPVLDWVLPVRVTGPFDFTLLATWTVEDKRRGRPGYESQVAHAIASYESELRSGCAVLAGDLNGDPHVTGGRGAKHLQNVADLEALGMTSAYHAAMPSLHGQEAIPTFFLNNRREVSFHCDFCFVPTAWQHAVSAVEVGSYDDWIAPGHSDHAPVTVTIEHDRLTSG
jgi:endonuclease/exonuclease/phosphatase family metal-dependent hydrolase